ncbi:MAG: LPS export ABC transporter periplasmic protein LptC [Bdellovibrionales bacterium]|nr:LPS export ABC transporter periplasmic protein LptC [Bdellovibrionales bacterium]
MWFERFGKYLLGALLVFFVVQLILVAPVQIHEGEKEIPLTDSKSNGAEIDQVMRDVHLVEAGFDRRDWELWAKEARSLKDKNQWNLDEVKVIFFSSDGVEFKVTGKEGTVHHQSKDMSVKGNVEIRTSNGYLYKTDLVNYSSLKKNLHSPGAVQMWGPKTSNTRNLTLTGVGLDANLEDSVVNILDKVRAQNTFKEGKKAFIKSDKATFSGSTQMAHFFGNVVIDYESMRLTGPKADFQYDSENKWVKSMYVDGGVHVSDAEKWATSKNVEVDFQKERYVFRGNPRIVQNNDELRGQEIEFLEGGKRVKVLGARARMDEKRLENTP